MSTVNLQFQPTTDYQAWDALVDLSPQGTVFSKSAFLRSLGVNFRLYTVTNGPRTLALIAAIEDQAGQMVRYPFTPYQGPMFVPDPQVRPRQRLLDEFRLTEFIVAGLIRNYERMAFSLSWHCKDMRPFLWHNYHEAAAPRFTVRPQYTAVLELSALEPQAYLQEIRACRRQEYKKAASLSVSDGADVEDFLRIYADTFARQSIAVDDARIALVRSIVEHAIDGGYGRLSQCAGPAGIASMCLFVYDQKRAYYLLAANDPAHRNSGAATRLMVDNIFEAKRRGLQDLDFVGVNSPNRGDFKLSFNPQLQLYFDVGFAEPSTVGVPCAHLTALPSLHTMLAALKYSAAM